MSAINIKPQAISAFKMSYIPLRGDFNDESDALIIQSYANLYDYTGYNNYHVGNYYISKMGLYTPAQRRLYEAYDNHPFRCKLMAEYNALRLGLVHAATLNANKIVINTDSEKLINQLIEAFVDDSESENSVLSVLSHDVEDLHDEVCQLLEEFDGIGCRLLDKNIMLAFEKYVSDNTALNKSMQNLSVETHQISEDMEMD
jgi:hypothetical protein